LVQKISRIKVHTNALAVPLLLYGSEVWTLRKKDKKRLISSEMVFVGRTAWYTLFVDKRNADISDDLTVETKTIQIKLAATPKESGQKRVPKVTLNYRPDGRTDEGDLEGLEEAIRRGRAGLSRSTW
jgi:hypothetical protein